MKEGDVKQLDDAIKTLRKKMGFGPMTQAEAERAYDEAEPVPMSAARIKQIVEHATKEREETERREEASLKYQIADLRRNLQEMSALNQRCRKKHLSAPYSDSTLLLFQVEIRHLESELAALAGRIPGPVSPQT